MNTPTARDLEALLMGAVLSKDKQGVEALLLNPDSRSALEWVLKEIFIRLLNGEDVVEEIAFLSFCEKFSKLLLFGLCGALTRKLVHGSLYSNTDKLASLLVKLFEEGKVSVLELNTATRLVGCMCYYQCYSALVDKLGPRLEED